MGFPSLGSGQVSEAEKRPDPAWSKYLEGSSQSGSIDMSRQDQLKMFGCMLDAAQPSPKARLSPRQGHGNGNGRGTMHSTLCTHDRLPVRDDEPPRPVLDLKEACPWMFPVFSWEEGDGPSCIVSSGTLPDSSSQPSIGVFLTSTQVPGYEGWLVDTGAVDNVFPPCKKAQRANIRDAPTPIPPPVASGLGDRSR